jgi:TIR domain
MLFQLQFPICDGRAFQPGATRLSDPSWPLPIPGTQFVRYFGPVQRRRRGGQEGYPDEVFYCAAARALRFDRLECRSFNRTRTLKPSAAFRRLMCDGGAVCRLEVGVTTDSRSADTGPLDVVAAVNDLLDLPVHVARYRDVPRDVRLWAAAKPLAELYAGATTPNKTPTPKDHGLVVPGELAVICEYDEDSLGPLPGYARSIDPAHVGGVGLAWLSLEYHGRAIGVWLLNAKGVDAATARRLRLGLMRVHAECQVLKRVLGFILKGSIQYTRGSAQGAALETYLNTATRLLSEQQRNGFAQPPIREAVAAYTTLASAEERDLLMARLTEVKRQVRVKLDAVLASTQLTPPDRVRPVNVFVSYSHLDAPYLGKDSLIGYLSGLTTEGFTFWTDRDLVTGDPWDDRIRDQVHRADIALLLVSQAFLNSRYCQQVEIREFLERRAIEGLRLYPIILSPCDWRTQTWLAELQSQPRDGKTVEMDYTDPGQRKALFLTILEELRAVAGRIQA